MSRSEMINSTLVKTEKSVGYIFISGMLVPNNNKWYSDKYTAIIDILSALEILENESTIETIAFIINSNGGSVEGLTNLNNKIKQLKKQTICYVNNNCLSAAYWIASACNKIIATSRAAFFGSIGVLSSFQKSNETIITNTDSPKKYVNPESEEGKKIIQEELDEVFKIFIETVSENRGKTREYVKEYFGQGSSLSAEQAIAVGLIDEINESVEVMPLEFAVLAFSKNTHKLAKQNNKKSEIQKTIYGENQNNKENKMPDNNNNNKEEYLTVENAKAILKDALAEVLEEIKTTKEENEKMKEELDALKRCIDEEGDENREEIDYDFENLDDNNNDKIATCKKANRDKGSFIEKLKQRNAQNNLRAGNTQNVLEVKTEEAITKAFQKHGITVQKRM